MGLVVICKLFLNTYCYMMILLVLVIITVLFHSQAGRTLENNAVNQIIFFRKFISVPVNQTGPRNDYIDWEDYFMATAFLAAKRSKDPCTQVGACIVNEDNIIVGVGYNGFPKGCSDNEFPWAKNNPSPLDNKFFYVCHAEMNAILNRNTSDTKGCRIYVALFPCNECAKFIIQSGIKEVIYMRDEYNKLETAAAKKMFDAAEVTYRQLVPKHKKIVIDLDEINWNEMR